MFEKIPKREEKEIFKFPKIAHLPWSCSVNRDDRQMSSEDVLKNFKGKTLIYMEKLDGENTNMSHERIFARSVAGGYDQPWQRDVRNRWEAIRDDIPDGMILHGENVTGVHAVEYDNLSDFFYVFGITLDNEYLSFEDTEGYAAELGLKMAPVIQVGQIEEMPIPEKSAFGPVCEGYVVRNTQSFQIPDEWGQNIAKCVREGHVQPGSDHWTKHWHRAKINWR